MTNRFKALIATLGLAALTTACGTAMPTASTPDLVGSDSTGAPTALFTGPGRVPPQPENCTSTLRLGKVASSNTSVSVQAIWFSKVDTLPVACGVPVWAVSPEAKTIVRRLDPSVITILGKAGAGYVVTAKAAGQTSSMKIAVGN
jgi:hypothetical protein